MFVEVALLVWSGLALAWWLISWRLVCRDAETAPLYKGAASEEENAPRLLTVFKPLAPLGAEEFDSRGIESFLSQLNEHSELLLGVHEADRARIEPWLARRRSDYPQAALRVVWREEPDSVPNPKIAWLKILAPHATGELWLWSDADIIAPPGFLRAARADYESGGAGMVTWPYVVREIAHPPAALDAFFVNAEFFPGVLLLRGLGPVDFGFGAAMLFSREDFQRSVEWRELGAALADDFVLGQRMRPVRIGREVLETRANVATWRAALLHYLRWSKTVRWNRPGGTAARLVVLPALGWLALVVCCPAQPFSWLGLAVVMQMDVLFAALICRRFGCCLAARDLATVELWSLGRGLVWLLCWLPWPVVWSGRSWWRPIDKT
jgi:ceramide glucosyltransferase